MAYVKKYATIEERNRAKSEAGKRGAARVREMVKSGAIKLGRPKGSRNKNPRASIPPKTMTVRKDDYRIYVKLAFAANMPIVEFMHVVAENLKAKNPQVFSDEAKVNV